MDKNLLITLADEICMLSEPILSLDKNIYFTLADEICTLSEAWTNNLFFTLADEICTFSEANRDRDKNLLSFTLLLCVDSGNIIHAFFFKEVNMICNI